MEVRPLSSNELIKAASPSLAGNIAQTLADEAVEKFSEDDSQRLKFHGIYQQDNRDKRVIKREYSGMVRTRQTGGVLPPEQYLVYDALADRYGNGTLRLTSRQTVQFHCVAKENLRHVVHAVNASQGTTLATAGDINRNVTAPPAPGGDAVREQVRADAFAVTRALLPTATAYRAIWLDGTKAEPEIAGLIGSAQKAVPEHPYPIPEVSASKDALYGETYLPRKFKISFAIPPRNDTDIFSNDLGFIAVVRDNAVIGYNVVAGGGMGTTHGNAATFPRIADLLGWIPRERVVDVALAVVVVHRDFGDRSNRRHARLKYLIEDRGVAWFVGELERQAGFKLAPSHPVEFTVQGDELGWRKQADGKLALALFVETGRIRDVQEQGRELKTALREVVAKFRPQVDLTPSQNIILGGILPEERGAVEAVFAARGVDVNAAVSRSRAAGLACAALPMCGFALAEAERVFPRFMDGIDGLLAELGLADEEISVRMTGCSNGCARPYLAEIGLVGMSPGKYNLFLGGDHLGKRLARLYRSGIKFDDILSELSPLLGRFKLERFPHEHFGDFAARVL
jgi:sulfite reductase (NADPH) hemoprotein beta-component